MRANWCIKSKTGRLSGSDKGEKDEALPQKTELLRVRRLRGDLPEECDTYENGPGRIFISAGGSGYLYRLREMSYRLPAEGSAEAAAVLQILRSAQPGSEDPRKKLIRGDIFSPGGVCAETKRIGLCRRLWGKHESYA